MTRIVKKIVKNFDDKRMRVLFHEPDLLKCCLPLFIVQDFHRILRPFDSKHCLIMLPDGSENIGESTLSNKVVLVRFVGVGIITLLGNTK
jgi:hypothetical protein